MARCESECIFALEAAEYVGLAEDIPSALAKSYGTIEQINYEGKYCRRDIGQDVMRYGKE